MRHSYSLMFQTFPKSAPSCGAVHYQCCLQLDFFKGCFHWPAADKWWSSITSNCPQNVGMSWGKYYSSRPLNEKRANFISTSIAFIFCESVQNIILVVKPGFTFLFCGFAIRLSSSSIQLHCRISPSLHRRNRSSF